MNFAKAYIALQNGDKIRRKKWEPLMHLKRIDDKIITYKGEYTNFYTNSSVIISDGWKVIEGDGKSLTFIEALDELRNKKELRYKDWQDNTFIFIDKEQIALCKPVEFEFMPTWECFNSQDWEIMK